MNAFAASPFSDDVVQDYRQDALWARLEQYVLDDPASAMPFCLRLARDNGWSRHYAVRVIAEYKKFCYLALQCGGEVTPSDAVDQAWHLHLIYSKNYWDEFCAKVLHQPLHHNPTRGGREQGEKFRGDYAGTLDAYRRIFGMSPPDDIWPPVDARFANASAFRRIDLTLYWVLPRPRLHFWRRRGR